MARVAGRELVLALALGAAGCGGGDPAPHPWFVEDARARGIKFRHRSGHHSEFYFPELMGGGAALFDMDGDGDLDAFLVQSGSLADPSAAAESRHGLYENRGDGTFVDRSSDSGVAVEGYGMGVAAGDYDGDGDVDLYVTNLGANVLLCNEGAGKFVDRTAEAGVGDEHWGTSACFFDMDGDGDLDLFVANYVRWRLEQEQDCFDPSGRPDYCGPTSYRPAPDTLYRNEGDGTFTDVSAEAGMAPTFGSGLGVVPADLDSDGRLDLFVANDQDPDQLWLNQGGGRFLDAAMRRGCAVDRNGHARAGMGVDAADIDDDDDLDLIVVHMARETDGLFRNTGRYFVEETTRVGIGMADFRSTRFGVGFIDFDADGWLDLFVANGRVNLLMGAIIEEDPYAEPNILMRGTPEGRWELVEPAGGTAETLIATSRGAAFGDVDGDGGVDVLVANRDGPAHLYMNAVAQRGHWLIARIVDEHGRDALGASARFSLGGRRVRRDVKPAYSYMSSSDPRVHVGLGRRTSVDEVQVRWPDGTSEAFGPLAADRVVTLRRGEGR